MTSRARPVRVVTAGEARLASSTRPPQGAAEEAARSRAAASANDPIKINARERVLLAPELAQFVEGLGASPARAEYEAALVAIDEGQIGGVALARLETFLEVGLSSGRLRARVGQHAEDTLRRLYERTPRGAALAGSVAEVTRALGELTGQPLGSIGLTLARPGEYRLTIEAGQYRLSVALAPSGARVESVELDL
jgi:hypothetical protein